MKKNERVFSWLWRVSAGDKAKIAAMTLVQVLLGGAAVLSAWLLRGIIDCAVGKHTDGFWYYGGLFIGLTLMQQALRAVLRRLSESCRSALENKFKNRLFETLLAADHGSVSAVHSGQWMSRLTSDTTVIADGLTSILPEVSGMTVKLLGALTMLILLLPGLAFVIIPGGCMLVLLTWIFRKRLKKLHKNVQEADGELRTFLTENLGAMLVIRAFGKQKNAQKAGREKMDSHRAARMKKNTFSNVCNIGFGLAIQGAYVLGALFCGYGILSGTMSYGTFTAVLQLIGQIQSPFANISGFVPKFYAMIASTERLMEAEAFQPDCPAEQVDAQALYEAMTAIRLENLTFTYPGDLQPALENRGLTVEKGNYIALTGHSGCGKSTVLKLMLALYPLDAGRLLLQTAQGEIPLDSRHRGLFAYVPQGNLLMSGTIRQVLTFGDGRISEEKLWKALQISCADTFVQQLDHGLDTLLGERGAGLSEGQMQRLSIARAVLADRPVLLLDEATSALDEATEAQVLQNLRTVPGKTVVIVTHRPAALAVCDREVSFE